MGGDFAPRRIIDGALAAARFLNAGLLLAGPEEVLQRELSRHPGRHHLDIRIADAPEVVAMDESPTAALRRKSRTSIAVAAAAVAAGDADALVSAGHTGATVMAAYAALGLLPGVDRPALSATIPFSNGALGIMLDVGANADCRPHHLLQFAMMGAQHAKAILPDVDRPRIGLLSIGEEETKGNELIREAHQLLKASPLNFIGNIEARDMYKGLADVIVCDGFTGNIALKTSEGLVDTIQRLLGGDFSAAELRTVRRRLDYAEYGGAPLLGVNGVAIVGHGRSSAKAVRNAVTLAQHLASERFIDRIKTGIGAGIAAGTPQSR